MRLARKEIDAALIQCEDETEQARLIEDDRRFEYGEDMVYFYYHLVRTALLHRSNKKVMAAHEFLYVEKYAEKLRSITDLVSALPNRSSGDANAKNGFEATQAAKIYDFFKERYGEK